MGKFSKSQYDLISIFIGVLSLITLKFNFIAGLILLSFCLIMSMFGTKINTKLIKKLAKKEIDSETLKKEGNKQYVSVVTIFEGVFIIGGPLLYLILRSKYPEIYTTSEMFRLGLMLFFIYFLFLIFMLSRFPKILWVESLLYSGPIWWRIMGCLYYLMLVYALTMLSLGCVIFGTYMFE